MTAAAAAVAGAAALMFVYAATGKLLAAGALRDALLASGMTPTWSRRLAAVVPCLELGLAAGLLFEAHRGVWLSLAAGLLVVFTVWMARVLRSGSPVGCACFGASQRPIRRRDLARNGALTAAIAAAALADPAPGAALAAGWSVLTALAAVAVTSLAAAFAATRPNLALRLGQE